jgi:hypothetical protein
MGLRYLLTPMFVAGTLHFTVNWFPEFPVLLPVKEVFIASWRATSFKASFVVNYGTRKDKRRFCSYFVSASLGMISNGLASTGLLT